MESTAHVVSPHQFWETAFSKQKLTVIDEQYKFKGSVTQRAFLQLASSDVEGLDVLEVGCGTGHLSVFLARCGANVTATDFSQNAIDHTLALAEFNGVGDRVTGRVVDGLDLPTLEQRFDLVTGRFVLHHIEPFDAFVDVLDGVLKENGRGIFMENNARNPFLMFARKYMAGKMGIPRYGDDEEYPLEPREIEMLEARFKRVTQHFPELVFFRKLDTYIFRHNGKFAPFLKLNRWVDNTLHRLSPRMRALSYLQIVEFVKGRGAEA